MNIIITKALSSSPLYKLGFNLVKMEINVGKNIPEMNLGKLNESSLGWKNPEKMVAEDFPHHGICFTYFVLYVILYLGVGREFFFCSE